MDKSFGITLMVLFGLSGVAAGVLCWVWPLSVTERFLDMVFAMAGIGVAVAAGMRSFLFHREPVTQPVKIEQR